MKFFESKNVKVFPASFRGDYQLTSAVNSPTFTFDPEARLNTEFNFTHISGLSSGHTSYVISYNVNNSSILSCSIGGYYFEIYTDLDEIKDKVLCIKTRTEEIINESTLNNNEVTELESTRRTLILDNFEGTGNVLDYYDENKNKYFFTGLAILDAEELEAVENISDSLRAVISRTVGNNVVAQINPEVLIPKIYAGSAFDNEGKPAEALRTNLNNIASGVYSFAEGMYTKASGLASHAEGLGAEDVSLADPTENYTTASNRGAHAEGYKTKASGEYSHAEGRETRTSNEATHAEGYQTKATVAYSHAEGNNTVAGGNSAHAEGIGDGSTINAKGVGSHSEGYHTIAQEDYSHAEGTETIASGEASHAEGYQTTASGEYSHTEGTQTVASGANSKAFGKGFNKKYTFYRLNKIKLNLNSELIDSAAPNSIYAVLPDSAILSGPRFGSEISSEVILSTIVGLDEIVNDQLKDGLTIIFPLGSVPKKLSNVKIYRYTNRDSVDNPHIYLVTCEITGQNDWFKATVVSAANGECSIVGGNATTATTDNAIALGTNTIATNENQVVIGKNNKVADGQFIIGVGTGERPANEQVANSFVANGKTITINNTLNVINDEQKVSYGSKKETLTAVAYSTAETISGNKKRYKSNNILLASQDSSQLRTEKVDIISPETTIYYGEFTANGKEPTNPLNAAQKAVEIKYNKTDGQLITAKAANIKTIVDTFKITAADEKSVSGYTNYNERPETPSAIVNKSTITASPTNINLESHGITATSTGDDGSITIEAGTSRKTQLVIQNPLYASSSMQNGQLAAISAAGNYFINLSCNDNRRLTSEIFRIKEDSLLRTNGYKWEAEFLDTNLKTPYLSTTNITNDNHIQTNTLTALSNIQLGSDTPTSATIKFGSNNIISLNKSGNNISFTTENINALTLTADRTNIISCDTPLVLKGNGASSSNPSSSWLINKNQIYCQNDSSAIIDGYLRGGLYNAVNYNQSKNWAISRIISQNVTGLDYSALSFDFSRDANGNDTTTLSLKNLIGSSSRATSFELVRQGKTEILVDNNGTRITNLVADAFAAAGNIEVHGDLEIVDDFDYTTVRLEKATGNINTGGNIQANSFYARSDKRLKENLTIYAPEKSILDLPIYKYDFINGAKNQIGCLAQDLQKICPELVQEDEKGFLSIQESKLVYLLLDEVKKLKEEIKEFKK